MRPIVQLEPQLANQIAAGEVVERPASVVKELLENSLDAGADLIDIEVLAGGTQLIRIRDNGHGIEKSQLTMALAPHATSKISQLDDLTALLTFGFRGEALASISSVSRFSMTSRTADQEQGWSAECHGKDMTVEITPAPATIGTRIDVAELFHNTPARRRFLRTEKTEFYQIETVVRQAVLANPKVTFSLKHNQRLVKRFRAAHNETQELERVSQILGKDFVRQAVRIDVSHEGMALSGWIGMPSYHRSQTDGQYFYVNRRPVKDKVLMHALRQAYLNRIPEGRAAAYVLFLEIEPEQVDVNVHPTKHEVRFHAVRTVHDFIVQALEQCIDEGHRLFEPAEAPANAASASGYKDYSETSTDDSGYSSGSYASYQSFIASAMQNVVNEEQPVVATKAEGQVLGVTDCGHLILFRNSEFLLIKCADLISIYNSTAEKSMTALMFPALLTIPAIFDAVKFTDWLAKENVEFTTQNNQVKVSALPLAEDMSFTADKLLCQFAYINNQLTQLATHHWLWLFDEFEFIASQIEIVRLSMSELVRYSQENAESR